MPNEEKLIWDIEFETLTHIIFFWSLNEPINQQQTYQRTNQLLDQTTN